VVVVDSFGVAGLLGLVVGTPVVLPGAGTEPVVWFGAVAPVDSVLVVPVVVVVALGTGAAVSAGAVGDVVVPVLALVPVAAKAVPDHQSREARTLGEAFR